VVTILRVVSISNLHQLNDGVGILERMAVRMLTQRLRLPSLRGLKLASKSSERSRLSMILRIGIVTIRLVGR
jgi:hypothetical protein